MHNSSSLCLRGPYIISACCVQPNCMHSSSSLCLAGPNMISACRALALAYAQQQPVPCWALHDQCMPRSSPSACTAAAVSAQAVPYTISSCRALAQAQGIDLQRMQRLHCLLRGRISCMKSLYRGFAYTSGEGGTAVDRKVLPCRLAGPDCLRTPAVDVPCCWRSLRKARSCRVLVCWMEPTE